jgi:ketosteroid isomerase-like protein
MTERATALLHAFARSDVEAIAALCAEDVLLVGTDAGERWHGRETVASAFAGAFDLSVEWAGEPTVRDDWLFGDVVFGLPDGARQAARVTMVFRDGLLAHAHYSVAA